MVIELTTEDQSRLSALAASMERSEREIAQEAMHWFLIGQEEDFHAAIAAGDQDFERGDVWEHHEVVAMFSDVLNPK